MGDRQNSYRSLPKNARGQVCPSEGSQQGALVDLWYPLAKPYYF